MINESRANFNFLIPKMYVIATIVNDQWISCKLQLPHTKMYVIATIINDQWVSCKLQLLHTKMTHWYINLLLVFYLHFHLDLCKVSHGWFEYYLGAAYQLVCIQPKLQAYLVWWFVWPFCIPRPQDLSIPGLFLWK